MGDRLIVSTILVTGERMRLFIMRETPKGSRAAATNTMMEMARAALKVELAEAYRLSLNLLSRERRSVRSLLRVLKTVVASCNLS